jgi:hypothetical protein
MGREWEEMPWQERRALMQFVATGTGGTIQFVQSAEEKANIDDYNARLGALPSVMGVAIGAGAGRLGGLIVRPRAPSLGVGVRKFAPTTGPDLNAARATGSSIGQGLRTQTSGRMASIASQVSKLGLSQQEAVVATKAAIQELGYDTAIVTVGQNTIVSSVAPGVSRDVLIVSPNGSVVKGVADITIEGLKFVLRNVRPGS